jgi:hypothetical protein
MKALILEAVMPLVATLLSIFVPAIMTLAYSRFQKWSGIEIESRQREALQSALANGVRLMICGLSKDHAIDYVVGSVPDALKGLKVDRSRIADLIEPHILAQKAALKPVLIGEFPKAAP